MSYGSLFGRSTIEARLDNWTSYLDFIRKTSGELLEADKDLTQKRELLKQLSEPAVRTRQPLASGEAFYRNCDKLRDDPRSLDEKTLTLTCIYKFARHEWAGIEAAWSAVPTLDQCDNVRFRIARYHLAEEFCHIRLFGEMFKTCRLDHVEWIPMPRFTRWFYAAIARFPYAILGAPALASELMGVTFYFHLKPLLNEVFADEPRSPGTTATAARSDHPRRTVTHRPAPQLLGRHRDSCRTEATIADDPIVFCRHS